MSLGGVGRKGYICTLSPPNRACLARQEVDARPHLPCSCCTMPRPRCLVILLPQGGGRDFRFGEMHDWPTGSSRVYDPRLARGCRCNVSRLVTYSVSSAGMGVHKVCMVSMGMSSDAPLDSACRLFWPIEPACMTYAATARRRFCSILPSTLLSHISNVVPSCNYPNSTCTSPHGPCRRSSAGT